MNVDTAALKHFGVDGELLDEGRLREFMKIPGIIVDSLDPGQHIDFVTLRIRNEGGGRVSSTKSHHAFIEAIQLDPGETFLLCWFHSLHVYQRHRTLHWVRSVHCGL
jgi:hypothetical protein